MESRSTTPAYCTAKFEMRSAFIKHYSSRAFTTSTPIACTGKPIILLDVDGVINSNCGDSIPWDYRRTAKVLGVRHEIMTIFWAPAVIDTINRWSESGLAEVRWLTMWNELAQQDLADKLGLRHFEVARDPKVNPDKATTTKRIAIENPTRPIVWIEDDLKRYIENEHFKEYFRTMQATLYVRPNPNKGITPEDVLRIDAFLAKPRQSNNYFEIVPSKTPEHEERVFCR